MQNADEHYSSSQTFVEQFLSLKNTNLKFYAMITFTLSDDVPHNVAWHFQSPTQQRVAHTRGRKILQLGYVSTSQPRHVKS